MYPFPAGDKWPILEADVKTLVIRRGGWNGTQNSLTPWDPEAKTEGTVNSEINLQIIYI